MEPENSLPKLGPEHAPSQYETHNERSPVLPTPETGIETGAERFEQTAEASAAAVDGLASLTVVPVPVVVDDTSIASPVIDDNPVIAKDDDLIEKEWVDRAKKIILDTRDDPYKREEAVSSLQKDYLKKRYGRELGMAE